LSSSEREQLKALQRQVKELHRANGVAPLAQTEYCSVKGVKDETKARGVRARISPADGGAVR